MYYMMLQSLGKGGRHLREDLNKYKLVSSSISIIFCAGQWGGATCATSQVMQGRAVWMCLVACRSSAQTPPCAPASEAAGSTRTDRIACRPAQSTPPAISAGSVPCHCHLIARRGACGTRSLRSASDRDGVTASSPTPRT